LLSPTHGGDIDEDNRHTRGLVGTHIPLEYVKQRYFAVTRTLAPDKDY